MMMMIVMLITRTSYAAVLRFFPVRPSVPVCVRLYRTDSKLDPTHEKV